MTEAEQLARYALHASYFDLSAEAREKLKAHVLDSIGCAIAAQGASPVEAVRAELCTSAPSGPCTMIGRESGSLDAAAFHNTALVRYWDAMDFYLAKTETCHPSDNFASILAAAETQTLAGMDFLAALAVAYHVQARLTSAAPVMRSGFDMTTQLGLSVTVGICRALRLDVGQTANALGMNGAGGIALGVTRTGQLSEWKGLASAACASYCMRNVQLARSGVTGPRNVFEGKSGLEEALGKRFRIDWERESIDGVLGCSLKRYIAQAHTQSCLEGVLELRSQHAIDPRTVARIEIDIFRSAYDLTGGGEFGERESVATKEQADHSLPWLVATALVSGDVMVDQYTPEQIRNAETQQLLAKVRVRPVPDMSRAFPNEMPCRIAIVLASGRRFDLEKRDYEGFFRRPMRWERVVEKFERLTGDKVDGPVRAAIVAAVANLDTIEVRELTRLLGGAR